MSLSDLFSSTRAVKRYIVDSVAHAMFYGLIGALIAYVLGIKLDIFITMSILGTTIQLFSGGIFGKFLDLVRKITNA
jgi:hypothetical protein